MLILLSLACQGPDAVEEPGPTFDPYDPLPLVDPMVGTGGIGAQVTGLNPGATLPNGLTLTGPDSRHSTIGAPGFYHFGGYHYDDDRVEGFAHTHSQGMGVNDLGGIHVMPRARWADAYTTGPGRMAPLDHAIEEASPGRYALELPDDGTAVEIVATQRGAHHRYTFQPGADPVVILDLGHVLGDVEIGDTSWVEVDTAAAEMRGFQLLKGGYSKRFGGMQTHFVLAFDPAPVSAGAWDDPLAPVTGATSAAGSTAGAWVQFPAGTTEVHMRAALSYVDLDGARANLAEELPDLDVEARFAEAEAVWSEALGTARVWGADEDRARFHTAAYHALVWPTRMDDVDGRYRGLDGEVHTTDGPYYSNLSMWDTFRTLHPWYTLVHPERQLDVARSLVRMADDGGSLPKWPMGHGYTGGMIGSPADIVLADTWLKGLRDFDVDAAMAYATEHAMGPVAEAGRDGIEDYLALGFVPAEEGRGTSKTLEIAWADAALANWAEGLGDPMASTFREHASNWRNTWDPAVGFFQDRYRDGSFTEFEGELIWSDDYVEGNAWHYLWTVPHDVAGMVELQHGGDLAAFQTRYADYWDRVRAEPEDDFPDDWYWHGNEPVFHYAWLGSLAGRPDLTVDASRWVVRNRYAMAPAGLDGNDDGGALSAWYLLASIGVYPIAGTPTYSLGSPIFERVELDTAEGMLVIEAPGTSEALRYPTRITIDGEALTSPRIDHAQLAGGTLHFELSGEPSAWGSP